MQLRTTHIHVLCVVIHIASHRFFSTDCRMGVLIKDCRIARRHLTTVARRRLEVSLPLCRVGERHHAKNTRVPPVRRGLSQTCRLSGEPASQTKASRNGGGLGHAGNRAQVGARREEAWRARAPKSTPDGQTIKSGSMPPDWPSEHAGTAIQQLGYFRG